LNKSKYFLFLEWETKFHSHTTGRIIVLYTLSLGLLDFKQEDKEISNWRKILINYNMRSLKWKLRPFYETQSSTIGRQSPHSYNRNPTSVRSGASLAVTGAKPHFNFGDKKKKESGFSESSSYIAFIYLKIEGSSNLQISVWKSTPQIYSLLYYMW
jgi:hypothetical protein